MTDVDADVRDAIRRWRQWSSGSIDELAAAGTAFVWSLGLVPLPETTAADRVTRRTIRYYISNRLMDPPEGERRLATYRYRHLLQLLYIKARQHAGDRLDQIRENVTGTSEHSLEVLLLETVPDYVPPPLPDDPGEFARPAHLDAVLARWAYLTGRQGRWRSDRVGNRLHADHDAHAIAETAVYSMDVPSAKPAQSMRHRVIIDIGEDLELSVPADHPLVHDEDGRRLILRGIQRMIRDYLRGTGPA